MKIFDVRMPSRHGSRIFWETRCYDEFGIFEIHNGRNIVLKDKSTVDVINARNKLTSYCHEL